MATFKATINGMSLDFLDMGSVEEKQRYRHWCETHGGTKITIQTEDDKNISINGKGYTESDSSIPYDESDIPLQE